MKASPFDPQTADEKVLADKKKSDREKLLKEVNKLANDCLTHKFFVKYKEKYAILRKETIVRLIEYNDPEPIRYAFNVRRMLDELRQLELLLNNVVADNKVKK